MGERGDVVGRDERVRGREEKGRREGQGWAQYLKEMSEDTPLLTHESSVSFCFSLRMESRTLSMSFVYGENLIDEPSGFSKTFSIELRMDSSARARNALRSVV